jgi:hypothetical protein
MIRMLRTATIGTMVFIASSAALGGEAVDVWVLLTEPAVAASATPDQLERVKQQQDRVMTELAALGAAELARVAIANNALAVRIDASKLADVKRIAGVRSVSRVRNIELQPPPPSR